MGRRSINTTKSGKYMNPTDQARKEARKKELKKNKKQRQMVRAAVLKGKDPAQLIEEMEKIDEMGSFYHNASETIWLTIVVFDLIKFTFPLWLFRVQCTATIATE